MQADNLNYIMRIISNNLFTDLINRIQNLNSKLDNEFLLNVQEKQINEALEKFVTKNVQAILNMNIELYDGSFRLSCTIYIKGIFVKVASNFDLVHLQLDQQRQRLVFAQQGETDVLELQAKSYLYKLAIKWGVPLYKKVTKKDPLLLILKKINLARIKENVIYIDIGRWLRGNKDIMTNLSKVQVNYAKVAEEQLILQANINSRNLLGANPQGDIITDADNPNRTNKPDK